MPRSGKPRLVDVAREAGVSPATVSRAIAQPYLLNPVTRDRVLDAAGRLGYRPDGMARALASGRTMTVGAIVPTLDSAIFARFLQAMQSALARDGYQLIVASHEMSPAAEAEAIRTLLARRVDGLVLVGAQRSRESRSLLAGAGLPVVLAWCEDDSFAAVTVDNERAGALAAEHLVALGHRLIGMVVGDPAFNDRQAARLSGARKALNKAGLSLPDGRVSYQPLTLSGGRAGCTALLTAADRPTAVIGGIDVLAIGCVFEAQAHGLNVPRELSIIGIDDIDMSAHIAPPLTTVHLPTANIGQKVAEVMLGEIAGLRQMSHIALPIELVVRQSTGKAGRQQ